MKLFWFQKKKRKKTIKRRQIIIDNNKCYYGIIFQLKRKKREKDSNGNLNDLISYRSSLVYERIDRACRSTDPDSCGNKSGDLEGNRCH